MVGTFTPTFVRQVPLGPDCIMEIWTYACAGGSTGGSMASDSHFAHVDAAVPASEVAALTVVARNATEGNVVLTCTANETGTLIIIGQPKRS